MTIISSDVALGRGQSPIIKGISKSAAEAEVQASVGALVTTMSVKVLAPKRVMKGMEMGQPPASYNQL